MTRRSWTAGGLFAGAGILGAAAVVAGMLGSPDAVVAEPEPAAGAAVAAGVDDGYEYPYEPYPDGEIVVVNTTFSEGSWGPNGIEVTGDGLPAGSPVQLSMGTQAGHSVLAKEELVVEEDGTFSAALEPTSPPTAEGEPGYSVDAQLEVDGERYGEVTPLEVEPSDPPRSVDLVGSVVDGTWGNGFVAQGVGFPAGTEVELDISRHDSQADPSTSVIGQTTAAADDTGRVEFRIPAEDFAEEPALPREEGGNSPKLSGEYRFQGVDLRGAESEFSGYLFFDVVPEDEAGPQPSAAPEPSAEPGASAAPEPSAEPEPRQAPEPSQAPAAGDSGSDAEPSEPAEAEAAEGEQATNDTAGLAFSGATPWVLAGAAGLLVTLGVGVLVWRRRSTPAD